MLSNQPVPEEQYASIGCNIKWSPADPNDPHWSGGGSPYWVIDEVELRAQIDAENRAYFDSHIDNALPNCAAQILDDLKSLKQGKMAEIIQKFSGEVPLWQWL